MKTLLIVSLGGFIGTAFRYIIGALPYKVVQTAFPYGTLLVNFLGCFFIGYFMEYALTKSFLSDTGRFFISIGILGGFTTFSTFSYEAIQLMRSGNFTYAATYVLGTNFLCFFGTFLGMKFISMLR